MSVGFRDDGSGHVTELVTEPVTPFDSDHPCMERQTNLAALAGKRGQFVVACESRAKPVGTSGHLAVYEFVVSPSEALTLNRARAFAALREQNEIAAFSSTYEHPIYSDDASSSTQRNGAGDLRKAAAFARRACRRAASYVARLFEKHPADSPAAKQCLASQDSEPQQSANGVGEEVPWANRSLVDYYAFRVMQELGLHGPDFRSYLERRLEAQPERPIRILSLASGAARIENGIIDGLPPERIELTLTDINPGLLASAKARFAGKARVDTIVMNVNQLSLPSCSFDVIVCVSALHHVVELERVIAQCAAALVEDGEFWSIGEYIGRNGTRLFDDAYDVADGFFRGLPESYRRDRNPGSSGQVDQRLPNRDCSATCFEGIRSEEIETIMDRCFVPIDVLKFDCFLWRLFNLAYLDNYDLCRWQDRDIVERAVALEADFVRKGGRPTAMHGVYRPKPVAERG
jgi:SAM-dependent methyltransferase